MSKSIYIAVSLLLFISVNIYAQSSPFSLNYTFEFNLGSYDSMEKRAGERGISASEFGRWLADNGQVSIVLEPGEDINTKRTDAELPKQHRLTLFLVDQDGSLQQSSYATFSYSETDGKSIQLSRLVSAREMGGLLGRLFPGAVWFPGADWSTDSSFLSSTKELKTMAGDYGRRVLIEADNAMQRDFALFITITPDSEHFEQDVSPAGVGFVGSF